MSRASHAYQLLSHLYGLVLRRMRAQDPSAGGQAACWHGLQPLEPRILFSVTPIGGELLPEPQDLDETAVVIDEWEPETAYATAEDDPEIAVDTWEPEIAVDTWEPEVAVDTAAIPDVAAQAEADYIGLPLGFEKNKGQTDDAVDFVARGSGYTVFLSGGDAVLRLGGGESSSVLRLDLVGADESARAHGSGQLGSTSNYMIGSDPDGWATGLRQFGSVTYDDVWEGVDVRYYGNQRQLEYDFIVEAGADADVILVDFQGAQSVHVADNGELVIRMWEGDEDVRFKAPYAYQDTEAGRVEVTSRYVITADGQVGFELGEYDTSLELVIDPILDYSTYLGGVNSDFAEDIAVDATGAIYLFGRTQSLDFPVGSGSLSGTVDVFVAKLQPNGAGNADLVFATYVGGSGGEYATGGIELDASGNIVIAGSTNSADFATTAGAYATSLDGSSDAYLVKLSADGDTLLYGTYFGGSDGDSNGGLALDAAGNAYITGQTLSNDLSTPNGYDGSRTGASDVYVAKLSMAGTGAGDLLYGTYLGGSTDYELSSAITVDASGLIYVATKGLSADHPISAGAYQTSLSGTQDGVLTILDPSLSGSSQLVYATFLGGSGSETINEIFVDASGAVYLTGGTNSADFPATAGAFQTTHAGGWDMFVAKLNPLGGGASDLVYATYIGTSGSDSGSDIYVDASGVVYVAGYGADGMPLVNAIQGTFGGVSDAYVAKLNLAGGGASDLLFGTYLGGADSDSANALAVDASGDVFVAGTTRSGDFTTTTGAYSETHSGPASVADAFVAKLDMSATTPAIALNGTSSDATAGAATSLTWSHTVYSGNDRALMVGIALESGESTSVTYGGTPLTLVGRYSGTHTVEIWQLLSPTVGTADIVANFNGSKEALGGGTAFNNVDQTTPTGSFQGAGLTDSSTASVTVSSAPGEVVLDVMFADVPLTATAGAEQAGHWHETNGRTGAGSTEAGAASVTMSWDLSESEEWTIGAVSIKPTGNNAPVVTDQAFSVDENAANGTSFGTVAANDPNTGDVLTYAITGGTGQAAFAINSSTGELTVADSSQLDYEAATSLTLTVEVTDDGSPAKSDTATMTVDLNNVADVFMVTTTADSGAGSLRQAILDANANANAASPDVIQFAIGTGAQTISLSSALPTITESVVIDGTTQPGYSGAPLVMLDGGSAGAGVNGLRISGGNSTIKGLVISNFDGDGIHIDTAGNNTIQDNYIGTNAAGTAALGNGERGIEINNTASNFIDGNVISGNDLSGIILWGTNADGNIIRGNHIGTNAAGNAAVANGDDGIRMGGGASSNTIGGTTAGERNVISGNGDDGIELLNAGTVNNTILGNYIGVDATGNTALGNVRHGVVLYDEVAGTTIGGMAAGAGNVISANGSRGVIIDGNGSAATANNTLLGNYIGTNAAGSAALGNGTDGVRIFNGAASNTIGGTAAGAGNVISGNVDDGIDIRGVGTASNVVHGNMIGTDSGGTLALGNGASGVRISDDSTTNAVGGTAAGAGNVISSNAANGVYLVGSGTTSNVVHGNFIGTDTGGTIDLGNSIDGVRIWDGAHDNTIGGTAAGAGNTIAYNSINGVGLTSSAGIGNAIQGNAIHSNGALGIDLSNDGVTANDTGTPHDADSGPNQRQNFPVLTTAVTNEVGTITIDGSINSAAGTSFRIEFFASTSADGSGHGEAETYLGYADVVTDGNGDGTFSEAIAAVVPAGAHITATATDPSGNTSEFSLNVVATPVNSPPVVNDQGFSIDENAANLTSVGTVAASDPNGGDDLTYTIIGGTGQTAFNINSSTGEITVADSGQLDFESTTSLTLDVQVTDDGVPNMSDTATITISLDDLNDTAPVVTPGQSFPVVEDAANGTVVGTVAATDADTIGSLSGWTITAGNGAGVFAIDGAGQITVTDNTALDYESTTGYTLTIQVSDGVQVTSETVTITVTDVNDSAPVITPGQSFPVLEDATNGTVVGTVAATDADTVGSLTGWTITAGNGDGVFAIDGSGQITVTDNTLLDYESTTGYTLTIEVNDGVQTVSETVTINVTDVNDTAPVITPGQSFPVLEDATNGTVVGTVAATDGDTVGSLSGWTITAGNGAGVFTIDGSGQVTVTDNTALDYESTTGYTLTIEVNDGVQTVSETVTINVTDVNDTAPVITPGQSFPVLEDATNGTVVGTVAATDADTVGSLSGWTITAGNGDGVFAIDGAGQITVTDNTLLDYESTTGYTLTIEVNDGVQTVSETVTITVTDVNDTAPVITPGQSFPVLEDATNGTVVGTVAATDADTVGSLTGWTITAGNGDGVFAIDGAGQITVTDNTLLDYESTTGYTLTIEVNDGVQTVSETVTISVTDVNDTAPVITPGQSFPVLEDATNGTVVGTVAATDVDTVGSLTGWTITGGNGDGVFAIDGAGQITVTDNTLLDYESTTGYTLTIEVNDGVQTVSETVTITVTDVNDTAPVITPGQSFPVLEDATNGTVVATVAATDADTVGSLSGWTITAGNGDGIFSIDGSGQITVTDNTLLDYESTTGYTLTIEVNDGVQTVSETVTITVTDVNDTAPVITPGQSFPVLEDATNGAVVGTVAATDADTVGSLTGWTITAGNGDGVFSIDGAGQITVTDNTLLDYESTTGYTLTIEVNDGVQTVSETVTITVTDVNDTAPVITPGQSFPVLEDATNGTVVGTVAATDGDTVGSLSGWTITSGNGDGIFAIDGSGQITVTDNTALDYESTTGYTLTIQVSDGVQVTSETVTITVTDVNDTAPVITPGQSFPVLEGATNGTVVGTVAATDADTVGSLSGWTITAGNGDGVFAIDGAGQITVTDNTLLDYESTTGYTLTIEVNDGVQTVSETVTITVTDVNDTAPVITPGQSFPVLEDATNGTVVGTVAATDADTVGSLSGWTVTAGNGDGIFSIDGAGQITVTDNTLLDYESTTGYTLTIEVNDGVQTVSETVTITVTDVNDTAPVITPGQSFTVLEDVTNGTVVGTVAATDADTVGSLSGWTITAGNGDGIFAIDGSGQITVTDNTLLDYESTTGYTLTIEVNDGVQTVSETVTISVTDVNDTAPVITPGQSFPVLEDATNGTVVGTVAATDVDTVGSLTGWTITGGNGDGVFAIDGAGQITVTDNTLLDYESTTGYTLTIEVNDGVQTVSETVTITVTDVNDTAPVITPGQSFPVLEDANNGTVVGTVAATDADTVGSLSGWTITAGNGDGVFSIDGAGQITVTDNTALDYESTTGYTLTVEVNDGVQTVSETVTITVTDVNDTAPVITPGQSFPVLEDATNGTVVGAVAATDADTVGSLSGWTITAGNGDGVFSINGSGQITVTDNTALDYESTTGYTLTIEVNDGVQTVSETVTITVTDVNDTAPVITPGQSFPVLEDATNGTVVGTVAATDADTVGSLSGWTITGGNGDGIFAIDGSGKITVTDNTPLDYESTTGYTLTIEVNDGVQTVSETVTITVTDVNDSAPVITPGQSFPVLEDATNGTVVGTVAATDADTVGSLSGWTITAGNGDGIFAIDGAGQITVTDNTALDYESTTGYTLTIEVNDGVQTVSENLTISVTDVNDTAPVITPGQSFPVLEDANNGTVVGTVAATDADTVGSLSGWTITAGNGDGVFSVDGAGQITVTDNTLLDYESTTGYTLTIEVNDGVQTVSETVTITVTDVNDTAPVITPGQSFPVLEDATNGTVVGTVAATDADTVGSLAGWTITSGNGDGVFAIDGAGQITVTDNTALDYESTTGYTLTIEVNDGVQTVSETVTITVTDVNDTAPVITPGQSFPVLEDATNGTVVATVAATDADTVGSLTGWTITAGNSDGIFAVDGAGQITVTDNTALDYESTTGYTLTIEVNDGVQTVSETVTITVTDVNDTAPVITPDQSFPVLEDATNGTVVGTVAATDADTVGSLSGWTITSGNGDGIFSIDGSGQLTVTDNTALDYESTTGYTLTIQVSDGVQVTSETVTITVTDVNDTAPVITPGQSFPVLEDATNGTVVGTVAATDADTVGSLTGWTITAGNGDGVFAIDGAGQITVTDNTLLDYESTTGYTLTIEVNDGVQTVSETVTITVTDVNDTAPVITPGQSFPVLEDATNGTVVGTVAATDADTVGSLSGWTITSGNGGGIFSIDGSGQLTVTDNTLLDYESTTGYTLTIEVNDGVQTVSETVTITVTDVNDTAPVITPGQSLPVLEDATNGTVVGTVAATDADTVGSLSGWTITAGNGDGVFAIDGSGQITVTDNTLLDYESPTGYTLTVEVNDGVQTVSETVTITVTDVNDTAPVITPGQSFPVLEDATNGTVVGTVAATDADTVGSLTGWTITAGNGDGVFAIDDSGQITVTDNTLLDYESTTGYTLTIQVSDGVQVTNETVTITVTNVNETPTTTGIADRTVAEDAADSVVDLFGTFQDTEDADADLTFEVVGNTNAGLFNAVAVDGIGGTLVLQHAPDQSGSAVLTIRATDQDGSAVQTTFTMTVTPVNDAPVITTNRTMVLGQGDARTITSSDLEVMDVDDASDQITYTISSKPTSGALKLDGSALGAGDTFTQEDIDEGLLTYEHDGGPTASDEFTFVVSDGSGATLEATVSSLSVTLPLPTPVPGPEVDDPDPEPGPEETTPDEETETTGETDEPDDANEPVSTDDEAQPDNLEPEVIADVPQVILDATPVGFEDEIAASEPGAELTSVNDRRGLLAGSERSTSDTRLTPSSADLAELAATVMPTVADVELQLQHVMGQVDAVTRQMRRQVADDGRAVRVNFGTAAGLTTAMSIGYYAWALRGGSLLASVLSAMPAWSFVDPLPVLDQPRPRIQRRKGPNNTDATESLIGRMLG